MSKSQARRSRCRLGVRAIHASVAGLLAFLALVAAVWLTPGVRAEIEQRRVLNLDTPTPTPARLIIVVEWDWQGNRRVMTATPSPAADTPQPTLAPTSAPASATPTLTPTATASATPTSTATPFPTPTQETVYLTTARLNLRTGPGTGYDVLTVLPAGVPVERLDTPPVAANGYTWWKIETAGGAQGWAASQFLRQPS